MGGDLAAGRFLNASLTFPQAHQPAFMMRRFITHPALALGSTLLWGAIELLALLRSRWNQPGRPH